MGSSPGIEQNQGNNQTSTKFQVSSDSPVVLQIVALMLVYTGGSPVADAKPANAYRLPCSLRRPEPAPARGFGTKAMAAGMAPRGPLRGQGAARPGRSSSSADKRVTGVGSAAPKGGKGGASELLVSALRRLNDPRDTVAACTVSGLLLLFESLLCCAILLKVPCASPPGLAWLKPYLCSPKNMGTPT